MDILNCLCFSSFFTLYFIISTTFTKTFNYINCNKYNNFNRIFLYFFTHRSNCISLFH